jgi:hypothetical protein
MSDPTKEYDTEREIHDAYDRLMDITTPARIERYRAAVRAETLREVRYEVEKVRQQITARAAIEFPRPSAATKDAINALVSLTDGILTALDSLEE